MPSHLDPLWHWLSYRLPRPLVYYCALRVMVHAAGGQYSRDSEEVSNLTGLEALKRWHAEERKPALP